MMMIRSTMNQLAKRPAIPGALVQTIAQQPGVLTVALQRLPFATVPKPRVEKTHTVPVEQSKEATPKPHHPLEPGRHAFWKNALWDDDDHDFFLRPHDPFAPFFGRDLPFSRFQTPSFFRNSPTTTGLTLLRSSPGYAWQQFDDRIELSVQVPEGVNAHVEVDDESRHLHIHGERSDESPTSYSKLKFDQRFALPANADIEGIKARVDGELKVTVPTTAAKAKRSIPVEREIPTDEEVVQKSYSDAFDESDWAETGKKAA